MPNEVKCSWCRARLVLRDDAVAPTLICPRCLSELPGLVDKRASTPTSSPVPTVATEAKRSLWSGYFIALGLTLLVGLGLILTYRTMSFGSSGSGEMLGLLIIVAFLTDLVLTALILYPAGYALVRASRPAPAGSRSAGVLKRATVILLLVVLGPVAAYIVFVAVCIAGIAVSGG